MEERRHADHDADERAGVRAGEEAREEGARQRQVGGVVVQHEPPDDPGRQRQAQAGREDQPLRPVAFLGQEDAPEPGEPHQHRRQRRDDRELGHERVEQDLLGRERLGFGASTLVRACSVEGFARFACRLGFVMMAP